VIEGANKHSATADDVGMQRPNQLSESGKLLEATITAAAEAIIKAAPMLDELDGKVMCRNVLYFRMCVDLLCSGLI
jgi:hypothetical protein